jgi:hypothetical protein
MLLTAYDWGSLGSVVDVGGGQGTFLAAVLRRYPRLEGVLFDMPHVVAGAAGQLAAVADRCRVEAGSFFERVPPGHAAYALKRILYSWSDRQAGQILRAVAAAMRPDSRLLVIEPLVVEGAGARYSALYDVFIMVMSSGRARTPEQMALLLEEAGLELSRTVQTPLLAIVEARRRSGPTGRAA